MTMRRNGPDVVLTCSICGANERVRTTTKRALLPGDDCPMLHIIVPLLMHLGDGVNHMALHPAMATEQMGAD